MDTQDDVSGTPPPQQEINEIIWSFAKAQLVYAAAKLGIPDLLRGVTRDASTIAARRFWGTAVGGWRTAGCW